MTIPTNRDSGRDGPKAYIVAPDGRSLESEENLVYTVPNLVLLTDDDKHVLDLTSAAIHRQLKSVVGNNYARSVSVVNAENVPEARQHLALFKEYSPEGRVSSLLDYNMGKSDVSRKPTESLFYNGDGDDFLHFAKNGGVAFFLSGYIRDVEASERVRELAQDVTGDFKRFAIGYAEKGNYGASVDGICRLMATAVQRPKGTASLKKALVRPGIDLRLEKLLLAESQRRR